MMLKGILLVFLGGGVGSVMRYGLMLLLKNYTSKFPYATLLANVISCILLGYIIGLVSKNVLSTEMKLLLMTGICGGFSTFSTFSGEAYFMFQTNQTFLSILYMGLSFILGLVCIYSGMKLAGV